MVADIHLNRLPIHTGSFIRSHVQPFRMSWMLDLGLRSGDLLGETLRKST